MSAGKGKLTPMNCHWVYQICSRAGPMARSNWLTQNRLLCFWVCVCCFDLKFFVTDFPLFLCYFWFLLFFFLILREDIQLCWYGREGEFGRSWRKGNIIKIHCMKKNLKMKGEVEAHQRIWHHHIIIFPSLLTEDLHTSCTGADRIASENHSIDCVLFTQIISIWKHELKFQVPERNLKRVNLEKQSFPIPWTGNTKN